MPAGCSATNAALATYAAAIEQYQKSQRSLEATNMHIVLASNADEALNWLAANEAQVKGHPWLLALSEADASAEPSDFTSTSPPRAVISLFDMSPEVQADIAFTVLTKLIPQAEQQEPSNAALVFVTEEDTEDFTQTFAGRFAKQLRMHMIGEDLPFREVRPDQELSAGIADPDDPTVVCVSQVEKETAYFSRLEKQASNLHSGQRLSVAVDNGIAPRLTDLTGPLLKGDKYRPTGVGGEHPLHWGVLVVQATFLSLATYLHEVAAEDFLRAGGTPSG